MICCCHPVSATSEASGALQRYLLVDTLKINQAVGDVLGVPNVVLVDLLIAAGALQDAIHEVRHGCSFIFAVFVHPFCDDRLDGFSSSAKEIG